VNRGAVERAVRYCDRETARGERRGFRDGAKAAGGVGVEGGV